MLWLAHLHVYPVLAGGALVAEGAGADHLGVAVDGDVAGRLVLAGVVLAQGVHLGSRQQIRIIRGANEEAGYESSDYDDYTLVAGPPKSQSHYLEMHTPSKCSF